MKVKTKGYMVPWTEDSGCCLLNLKCRFNRNGDDVVVDDDGDDDGGSNDDDNDDNIRIILLI